MELLQEWVERLGLQEWRIKLKTDCKEADMRQRGSAGCVEFTECRKTAVIEIMAEEEYGDRIVAYDLEETLVHELLHLKFSLLDDSAYADPSFMPDRFVHQLLDDMARALICAKRGITKIGLKE